MWSIRAGLSVLVLSYVLVGGAWGSIIRCDTIVDSDADGAMWSACESFR